MGLLDTLMSLVCGILPFPTPCPVDMEQNQKIDIWNGSMCCHQGRYLL